MDQRAVSYLAFNPNSVSWRLTPTSSLSNHLRKKEEEGKKE